MTTLKIQKLAEDAIVPTRGSSEAAGYDLYSYETGVILPGSKSIVDTKISMEIPKGYCGLIWSRSGLSVKNSIETGAGVIDSDYRGSIMVILHNHGKYPFKYEKGMRIAQMLITQVHMPDIELVYNHNESKRGKSGFGSTGLF
jgi:dUTP pyrophosphatase